MLRSAPGYYIYMYVAGYEDKDKVWAVYVMVFLRHDVLKPTEPSLPRQFNTAIADENLSSYLFELHTY